MIFSISDSAVQRLVKNALHLLGSTAALSAFTLASTVVAARVLSVSEFGQLSLFSAYALTIGQLIGFQSTYGVVKHGVSARARSGPRGLLGVVRAGALLDIWAGILASAVSALGLNLAASVLGFDPSHRSVALAFCLANATNVIGAPTAILRLQDKYRAFLIHGAVSGIIRLALTLLAVRAGGGANAIGLAWVVAQVSSSILLCALGALEYRRVQKQSNCSAPRLRETFQANPGLLELFVTSNLTATMRMIRDVDILALGWIANAHAVGMFKIARQVGSVLIKITDPFYHSIFPDLAEAYQSRRLADFRRLALRSSILIGTISGVGAITFWLVGKALFVMAFGSQYEPAFYGSVLCLLGGVVWAFSHPLTPALMVVHRQRALLYVTSFCSVAYIGLLCLLTPRFEAQGGCYAYLSFHVLWSLLAGAVLAHQLGRTTRTFTPRS